MKQLNKKKNKCSSFVIPAFAGMSVSIAILFPLIALAADAQQSFQALRDAIELNNAADAGMQLSQASQPLYKRFVSYNLLPCLPKDTEYYSQQTLGNQMLIKALFTAPTGGRKLANLIFIQESGAWKFDLPQTLHRGLGKNWESHVNLTEQLYLMLRQQVGPDKLSCGMVNELIKAE